MDPVTLAVVGGAVVAAAAFLEGCGKKREEIEIEETTTGEMKKIEIWTDKPEPGEPVVSGACVMCTNGISESDKVHVVDSGGEMVEMEGIRELSRKDIRLSGCFSGCRKTTDHLCTVSESDIEDQEWKDFDESRKLGEGKEVLDIEKSYMICLKGFGMIYFKDSGQVVRSAWDTLCRVVNEDVFLAVNKAWTTEKLRETYQREDIYELMRREMFQAGIVDETSAMMFIVTIEMESGYGWSLTENLDDIDEIFKHRTYSFNTRGAGLIQVTGETQRKFIEYMENVLPDSELRDRVIEIKDGYDEDDERVDLDGNPIVGIDHKEDAAAFIENNFPLESAIWFWSVHTPCSFYYENGNPAVVDIKDKFMANGLSYTNVSINSYIEQCNAVDNNEDNLFLVSQYYVNGQKWLGSRLQEMALKEEDVDMTLTDENGQTMEEPKVRYAGDLVSTPNGWTDRKTAWENIKNYLYN